MKTRNFFDMLAAKWAEGKFICVGLDTDFDKIPAHLKNQEVCCIRQALFAFNKEIIDATKDLVCAYKPNSAFYEAYGWEGVQALEDTIRYIVEDCADDNVPVILDAKRGDIDNTNNGYVKAAFDKCRADAVTISPYFGPEANKPWLDCVDKGIVILCRTSNKGAGSHLQDLALQTNEGSPRVFEHIAKEVRDYWNYNNNCLLVVGATAPEQLITVRKIVPNMPLLVPGVGEQGGELIKVLKNGLTANNDGLIINSSRGIIYASSGIDFAEVARAKVLSMNKEVEEYLIAA